MSITFLFYVLSVILVGAGLPLSVMLPPVGFFLLAVGMPVGILSFAVDVQLRKLDL